MISDVFVRVITVATFVVMVFVFEVMCRDHGFSFLAEVPNDSDSAEAGGSADEKG